MKTFRSISKSHEFLDGFLAISWEFITVCFTKTAIELCGIPRQDVQTRVEESTATVFAASKRDSAKHPTNNSIGKIQTQQSSPHGLEKTFRKIVEDV